MLLSSSGSKNNIKQETSRACCLLHVGLFLGLFFGLDDGGKMSLQNVSLLSTKLCGIVPKIEQFRNKKILVQEACDSVSYFLAKWLLN
jgi:hypothetical protein